MIKLNWHKRGLITTDSDITQLINDANLCKPNVSGFDTETTGLHIILDKPFLFQLGFYNTRTKEAYVYYVDKEHHPEIFRKTVKVFWEIAELTNILVGANVKYDLHMMENEALKYPAENVSELQVMIRLANDALPVKKGGPPLALKLYAAQYVDKGARYHEEQLSEERSKRATVYNNQLKLSLKEKGILWGVTKPRLEDAITEIKDLGPTAEQVYNEWLSTIPKKIRLTMTSHLVSKDDIPYNMLNREVMYTYAMYDVIYTLEIVDLLLPILKTRKQWRTFERENALVMPLYRMERVGFRMNIPYIQESYEKLRAYIIERREDLNRVAGETLKSSQNKRIKELLYERFGEQVSAVGKDELEELIQANEGIPEKAQMLEFISLIQELRTLEKWFVTYLMRFLKESEFTDTMYALVHQAKPVTGRLSSNLQQFPKKAIKDKEGNVLFKPRDMVQVPNNYHGLAFIDYSQIELRFQALYTILLGHPDKNLCRAYMPLDCHRISSQGAKVYFDYNNIEDIKGYEQYKWFLNEDEAVEWHNVDVHAATTKEAFPELDPTSEEFASWRGIVGKRTNFAKNYGATRKTIAKQFRTLKFSEEKITQIDESYYKAFPGVKEYQKYCYQIARNGFMTNLFGRRYYNISGHNGINALVQGSAADFLKESIIKLDKYIRENNLKSCMVINIHDEICFAIVEEEIPEIMEFQRIMQDFPETKIPIVADLEYTTTLWGEKEEIHHASDIDTSHSA